MARHKTTDNAKFIAFIATAPIQVVQITLENAKAVLDARLLLTSTKPTRTTTIAKVSTAATDAAA